MLRLPNREQSYQASADMVAVLRWPATVAAVFMLSLLAFGLIIGEEKVWPPSPFAQPVAYFCFSAALSWTGWYDQRTRRLKGSDASEENQERYHFWKWKGTPRWLYILQMILAIIMLASILSQPSQRIYGIAFIGFLTLMTIYDYRRWRSRYEKRQRP